MGAISRTGTISVIHKFKLHKFRLSNLHYNPQSYMRKTLDAIVGENTSGATKIRTILQIRDVIDVP